MFKWKLHTTVFNVEVEIDTSAYALLCVTVFSRRRAGDGIGVLVLAGQVDGHNDSGMQWVFTSLVVSAGLVTATLV